MDRSIAGAVLHQAVEDGIEAWLDTLDFRAAELLESLTVLRNQVLHGDYSHAALFLQNLRLGRLPGSWRPDQDDEGAAGLSANDSGKSKQTRKSRDRAPHAFIGSQPVKRWYTRGVSKCEPSAAVKNQDRELGSTTIQ